VLLQVTVALRNLVLAAILGIYTVSDENRKNAIKQPFGCLVLPCFWPHAIVCSPCICVALKSLDDVLASVVYVITDKRVYQSVDVTGGACCIPGKDSGDVTLNDINGTSMDMPGSCGGVQCCPVKQVVLGLPLGHPLANAGGTKHTPHTKMQMFVDDPDAVIALLRKAKDAYVGPGMGAFTQPIVVPMEMARAEPDAMDQMAKLKTLLDSGVINQAEYDEKRKELLSKI